MEPVELDICIEEINGRDYNIPSLYISPMSECNISILCGSNAYIKKINSHATITFKNFNGCILLNGIEIITNTYKECTIIINGPHEYETEMRIDGEE